MATITDAEQWPEELERERSLRWTPDFGNEAGPPALDGTRQYRNTNGGGLWRAAFNTVQLRSRPQVLAWLATEALLQGGKTPIDVPLLLCQLQPRTADHTPIVITASGGWAAQAMSGRVDLENAGTLTPGMHFSDYDATIYGWRLHRIMTVSAAGSGGGPNMRDITFWPPARFAVADNHQLEFDEPRCVMRLEGTMDVELEMRRRGDPSVEFIEAF